MFLDPFAAKVVMDSGLNVTLIPLDVQRSLSSFNCVLQRLELKNHTPEAALTQNLLSRLSRLQQKNHRYRHMVIMYIYFPSDFSESIMINDPCVKVFDNWIL